MKKSSNFSLRVILTKNIMGRWIQDLERPICKFNLAPSATLGRVCAPKRLIVDDFTVLCFEFKLSWIKGTAK